MKYISSYISCIRLLLLILSSSVISSFTIMDGSATTAKITTSKNEITTTLSMSNTAIDSTASASSAVSNIAVFGCGVLGTSLCQQLLASNDSPSIKLTGITKTSKNHDSIKQAIGYENNETNQHTNTFHLTTYDEILETQKQQKDNDEAIKKFQHVIFCAPPSGFENYPLAVQDVIQNLWMGTKNGGSFVFTSSGGIYGPGNGEVVTESTPITDAMLSPRSQRLLDAEQIVLSNQGTVLRLAGLYNLERGAHSYWLSRGMVQGGTEDGLINLLHYDDAASSCMAVVQKVLNNNNDGSNNNDDVYGKIFLVSDGMSPPLTRKEICVSTLKSKAYKDMSMPEFVPSEKDPMGGGKGKIYNVSKTFQVLNWKPKYPSFDEFMKNN